jgi:translation elongation factor EF-G
MPHVPVESFIIERVSEGGWRVVHRRADLSDLPIADFVSLRDAEEWVSWKSGRPKINPYATAEEDTQPGLIEIAIEPKSKAEGEKLLAALAKLAAEDATFKTSIDHESGQIILKGASELHLDAKIDALKHNYDIAARVSAPQVAFRECITGPAELEYTHKKQSGVSGRFAVVRLRVEPCAPGTGYQFESRIAGGALPKEYVPSIEKGIGSVLPWGVVAGFPVVDIKVTLIDGTYHEVDSSAAAFESAACAAFREALQKAGPVLLEPIMKVEVLTPEDCIAAIFRDLNLRRGRVQRQDKRGTTVVIDATAPLMNMFGYSDSLSSISRGRAAFTMRFDRYAPAPPRDNPPFGPAIGMRG